MAAAATPAAAAGQPGSASAQGRAGTPPPPPSYAALMRNLRRKSAKLRRRLLSGEGAFVEPPAVTAALQHAEHAPLMDLCRSLHEVRGPNIRLPADAVHLVTVH